jgi:hypothetical protein
VQESFPAQHIPHRLHPIPEAPSLAPELDHDLIEPILKQPPHRHGLDGVQRKAEIEVEVTRRNALDTA